MLFTFKEIKKDTSVLWDSYSQTKNTPKKQDKNRLIIVRFVALSAIGMGTGLAGFYSYKSFSTFKAIGVIPHTGIALVVMGVALAILGHEVFQVSRNISKNLTMVRTLLQILNMRVVKFVRKRIKKNKIPSAVKTNPVKMYTKRKVAETLLANTFIHALLFQKTVKT